MKQSIKQTKYENRMSFLPISKVQWLSRVLSRDVVVSNSLQSQAIVTGRSKHGDLWHRRSNVECTAAGDDVSVTGLFDR